MMRALVVACCLCWAGAAPFEAAPRPNIVWVMADDLGWGEVGLFPSSSPHGRIATPHLDRFGREGMMFTRAYAGYTVCAPSRTTFFTGRHSGQFPKHGLDGKNIRKGQPGVTTLPEFLKSAGYATGAFGKTAPLADPQRQGFDAFVGQVVQKLCHNMYPRKIDAGMMPSGQMQLNLTGNWRRKDRELCMASPDIYNYTVDVFHDSAVSWLDTVAGGPRPFFLYLSFTIPHAGGWGDAPEFPEQGNPAPTDLQYADKPWPAVEKDHAAVITYLDSKVGELLSRLRSLGVDNETIVFFASDNGAHVEGGHRKGFFDSTGGLRGQKRSYFEGGVRSPTMARWPGTIPAGSRSSFAWAFWDVLPTLVELAGAEAPSGLDGISIVPTLLGKEQQPHEYLYFTWAAEGPGYAVTQGDWKGVVNSCADGKALAPSADDAMELYNLEADPQEASDVASQRPDMVKRLKALVIAKDLRCCCFQLKKCARCPKGTNKGNKKTTKKANGTNKGKN